jgi:hypothetical protein
MVEINNTISAISGISDMGSWFSMVVIVGICAVLLSLFIMALSSFERYARTKKWLMWILGTLKYFCFGILTLIVIAMPVLVVYYFLSQAHKGNVAPLKISLYLIGGYIAICLIGWLGKKVVYDRIKKFDKKYQKENKDD